MNTFEACHATEGVMLRTKIPRTAYQNVCEKEKRMRCHWGILFIIGVLQSYPTIVQVDPNCAIPKRGSDVDTKTRNR